LNPVDIKRFPGLIEVIVNPRNLDKEKALIFLHEFCPEKVTTGFQIRAVLLPKVVAGIRTRLTEVSAATGLKALAPSTIFQLPGAGEGDLRRIAKLIRQVPIYMLELGEDTVMIPNIILDLLSRV
jgi:hypothetical protein